MMKSFFKKLAFVMALAMVVSAAAPAAQTAYAATEFTYAYQNAGAVKTLYMEAGDAVDLCFKGVKDHKNYSLEWKSANPLVAVVDSKGVVTAIENGTTTIELLVGDGTVYTSTPVNVVVGSEVKVALGTSKNDTFTEKTLEIGQSVDLGFYGVPNYSAKNYSHTWISNAPEVAKVDQKGVVTAVAAGSATVTIAIVNNVTGDTLTVTPVVVTVPAPVAASTFTAAQKSTTALTMTFDAKKDVKAEDVEVIMMINDVEAPIPVKSVKVEENVATVELLSNFTDGLTYKVNYAGETKEFVASVGDIDRVSFEYWSVKEGDNVAYVSTDEDPVVATLVYKLYDANGIDVTAAYDEDELSVEYELASENDDYEVLDNELTFFAAGAAVVEITVTWSNEEGDDVEKTGNGVVVATKRPALAHKILEAGFINVDDDKYLDILVEGAEEDMKAAFTKNKDSFYWTENAYNTKWVYGDEGDFQFAALVEDNRGNKMVTGRNNYGNDEYDVNKDGETIYPYGYFKFATSNDDVVDVDEDGTLSFWGAGTASVITYFVDTTEEEEKEVFVGATKITVSPERYPATYAFASTSIAVASETTGADNNAEFTFTVRDQYGDNFELENGAKDVTVETTSKDEDLPASLKTATVNFSTEAEKSWGVGNCTTWWCGNSQGDIHYHIFFDGDDFAEYLGKDSSKTVQYLVTFDKEENDKMTSSATTKIKVTVKNTSKAAAELGESNKYYYAVGYKDGKSNIDAVVNYAKNFKKTNNQDGEKWAEVQFKYLTASNGFELMSVPLDNIEDVTARAKAKDMPETGEAGKIYYVVDAPKDAFNKNGTKKNWDYTTDGAGVHFTFNSADGDDTLKYAVNGTYKVTAYYVKNTSIKELEDEDGNTIMVDGEALMGGKLSKLGSWSIGVSNSQVNPKFEGYDDKLGNKTTETLSKDMSEEEIFDIVTKNLVFSYNGTTIDAEDFVVFDPEEGKVLASDEIGIYFPMKDGKIDPDSYTATESKLRINEIVITVPVDDNNDATSYTYSKKLKVGKSIYFEEEE